MAWRKLDQIPTGEEAAFWLYAVARRTLLSHRRKTSNRRRLTPRLWDERQGHANDPEEQLVRNDEARTVLDAIAKLRDTDRELIRLAYWDELPHQAIADLLGCSRSAVDVRLHRAVRRLKKALAIPRHLRIDEMSTDSPKEPQC